jgi:hypothetical protein
VRQEKVPFASKGEWAQTVWAYFNVYIIKGGFFMATYKTPGVYVEELSILPPSVAGVATAVPAFIGYTEKTIGDETGPEWTPKPVKIKTFLEFESLFGGPVPTSFDVEMAGGQVDSVSSSPVQFYMYYALAMYFKNGGGPCYIVSVGTYANNTSASKPDMLAGLNALKTEDEPTLIVLTDGVSLPTSADYHEICQAALLQCANLKDRFCIFDVQEATGFRNGIGINDLKYGAAYYPYLNTSLNHVYRETDIRVKGSGFSDTTAEYVTGENGIRVFHAEDGKSLVINEKSDSDATKDVIGFDTTTPDVLEIKLPHGVASLFAYQIIDAWSQVPTNERAEFNIEKLGSGSDLINTLSSVSLVKDTVDSEGFVKLPAFKYDSTSVYNKVKAEVGKQTITMPPSAAVAGLYAKVDRQRGVWKAPANYSLAGVISPTLKLTDYDQESLNVDATAGKSINAIRTFAGKGTLVWGARTLAGNDNEWRYVSVRRLFNYIEESVQKATGFAVFEPNAPVTWLKVRTMISVFLEGLWKQGALVGADTSQAFFVNVGLGKTMTEDDILAGYMNIEIGIAAVRPAEFIVLKFSHKLQNS